MIFDTLIASIVANIAYDGIKNSVKRIDNFCIAFPEPFYERGCRPIGTRPY